MKTKMVIRSLTLFLLLFFMCVHASISFGYQQLVDRSSGHELLLTDADLPVHYVIDTDSFTHDEASAIQSAFDAWGGVDGSRIRFVRDEYKGQTLNTKPCSEHVSVHLVTKKKIEDLPLVTGCKDSNGNEDAFGYRKALESSLGGATAPITLLDDRGGIKILV